MADSADLDIEVFRQSLADALPSANIPTLLLLLFQFTGEERWLLPPFTPEKSRWDDNDSGGLLPSMQEEVRDAALEAILAWKAGAPIAKPDLSADELIRMLTVSEAEAIPADYAEFMIHKLRRYSGALPEPVAVPEGFHALIIGAGMSGVAAAVRLRQAGVPYTIIEKQDSAGGVWHSHHYPGLRGGHARRTSTPTPSPAGDWSHYFPSAGRGRGLLPAGGRGVRGRGRGPFRHRVPHDPLRRGDPHAGARASGFPTARRRRW